MGRIAAKLAHATDQANDREYVHALFQAIDEAEGDARDTLARTLQAIHNPEFSLDMIDFLVRNLSDELVADQARDALARIIPPDHIQLLADIIHANPDDALLKWYLLETIRRIDSNDAIDSLVGLCLITPIEEVKEVAAESLRSIGSPDAADGLLMLVEFTEACDYDDPFIQSLMFLSNSDSQLLLQNAFLTTDNPVIRYATAHALVHLKNQETASANNLPPGP